jgi:hypothetical protein
MVVCPFVLFLLAIVLSVILRYAESDNPFGIFKLFLHFLFTVKIYVLLTFTTTWGRYGHDHMVVGFTTIHAINAYHH